MKVILIRDIASKKDVMINTDAVVLVMESSTSVTDDDYKENIKTPCVKVVLTHGCSMYTTETMEEVYTKLNENAKLITDDE